MLTKVYSHVQTGLDGFETRLDFLTVPVRFLVMSYRKLLASLDTV
jgi:hypothetical protein